MKSFKEIRAWQLAYKLTLLIYRYSVDFPKNEEFGLKSQIRRASVSIISNIAEGFKRNGIKDKLRFYNQSQSSLEEVKCQAMLAHDLGYFDEVKSDEIDLLSDRTGQVLYKWMESQSKKSDYQRNSES